MFAQRSRLQLIGRLTSVNPPGNHFLFPVEPSCPSAYLSEVGAILVQFLFMIFYTSWVFLFVGTCLLGLCISGLFPSMLAFTEDILDYKGNTLSACFNSPALSLSFMCHTRNMKTPEKSGWSLTTSSLR